MYFIATNSVWLVGMGRFVTHSSSCSVSKNTDPTKQVISCHRSSWSITSFLCIGLKWAMRVSKSKNAYIRGFGNAKCVNYTLSEMTRKWQQRHLGSGFDRLEGYVLYATLYGKSPDLISAPIKFNKNPEFLTADLDKMFREIGWKAVVEHPLSGVADKNKNGIGDHLE